MNSYPKSFSNLIEIFTKLPGVGPKTAERYAFHLLRFNNKDLETFGNVVANFKKKIKICKKCFTLSDADLCHICSDTKRDQKLLCVVENIADMYSIEKSGTYKGLYHILQGVLSPIDGIVPENIRISELVQKIKKEDIEEVIIATSTSLEGDMTASYIANIIKNNSIKISRIASGIPVGSNLKYMDKMTIKQSIDDRKQF